MAIFIAIIIFLGVVFYSFSNSSSSNSKAESNSKKLDDEYSLLKKKIDANNDELI